jgi:uncharacterized protein (DUF736 family)
MRIAIGKKQASGRYQFQVAAPFLPADTIEIGEAEKTKDNAPDWVVTHHGERCGAFWKRTPRGGGDTFLSGHLESPAFPGGKLEVAIFILRDGERRGEMDMIWSPPRDRNGSAGSNQGSASAPATSAPTSTAGADDDDIPF